MRFSRILLVLPLLLGSVAGSTAFAAPAKGAAAAEPKLPKIEPTGISEFDSVFMEAKGIHEIIDTENTHLKDARKQVSVALGVAEDAPLQTAFEDLKKKANGKIKTALKGKMPRLEATEAVPENVQTGIDAVNKLLDAGEAALGKGEEVKPRAVSLGEACADFPDRLSKMGLDPMKLAGATPKVLGDVKATGATVDRVDRLLTTAGGIFKDLAAAFPE